MDHLPYPCKFGTVYKWIEHRIDWGKPDLEASTYPDESAWVIPFIEFEIQIADDFTYQIVDSDSHIALTGHISIETKPTSYCFKETNLTLKDFGISKRDISKRAGISIDDLKMKYL